MKKRSRWALVGVLGAIVTVAAVLAVLQWIPARMSVPDDALRVPQDVGTLSEALDRVAPGGTIAIAILDGAIQGPLVITVPDIQVISLEGRPSIVGQGAEPALTIQADGVQVSGFDIQAESIGILISGSDCSLEDLDIVSDTIGIQLENALQCRLRSVDIRAGTIGVEITGCGGTNANQLLVSGASQYGVRLRGSWGSSLSGFTLSNNAIGLALESKSTSNLVEHGAIEFCSVAGIEVRGSNDNRIFDVEIDSSRVGVVLEGVTGTELERCDIRQSTVSGVLLQQAMGNRIVGTNIAQSQGTGIQLTQSADNAMSSNVLSDCSGVGISLISSGRNLVFGNQVLRCLVGVHVERSSDLRVLRNLSEDSGLCGYLIAQGGGTRLLDNRASGGLYGIVVFESRENILRRNVVEAASRAGISVVSSYGDNVVSDNVMASCTWGLMLVASARDLFTYNSSQRNAIGALLSQLGPGVRIEGNDFVSNVVGLLHKTDLGLADELAVLGLSFPAGTDGALPVLANNVFSANTQLDIQNDEIDPLLAAGNWWGKLPTRDIATASVSDGVSLDQSAWAGVVAIGAGSDDVRVLLGRILEQTLEEDGFQIIDLIGLDSSARVQRALLEADVDLVWWSTPGDTLDGLAEAAQSIVLPSSAYEGWSVVVSSHLAELLPESSISGLAAWARDSGEQLKVTALTSLGEDAFDALTEAYGMQASIRSLTQADVLEEVEALLKFGAVDVAIVGSLDETLTFSGFQAIEDDLEVLERNSIYLVIQGALAAEHPDVQDTLTELGKRLTSDVLHDLVSRIRLLHEDPEDVAREFLQ